MLDQFNRSTAIKIAAAVGAGVGTYILYKKLRDYLDSRSQKWVQVGRLSEIVIFPIKSCKGRQVPEAECEPLGPRYGDYYDRRFVFADSDSKFVTARDEPQLVLVNIEIDKNSFTLSAPRKEPIRTSFDDVLKAGKVVRVRVQGNIPIDAYDCGSDISDWINDYLQKPGVEKHYRLYYHMPGLLNKHSLDNFEKWAGFIEKRKDLSAFTDLSSYMLMTETSMDDLNTRTPNGEQFSIHNFRPNFIVAGTKPFDEDNWTHVRIGEETEFKNIMACTRCVLTTVNWETGEKHPRTEPLRTLRTYRQTQDPKEKKYFGVSPMLGINIVAEKLGTVRVGDNVYVKYKRA